MVMESLKNKDSKENVRLWNKYCDDYYIPDFHIFDNNESFFVEQFKGKENASEEIKNGNYNENHAFVCLNSFNELQSFDNPSSENSLVDFEALCNWIIEEELD